MKKLAITALIALSLTSTAWAAETTSIHDVVNNTQAQAHQMQSTTVPVKIQGSAQKMAEMNPHEQSIVAHDTMKNAGSDAHQQMADEHQKMMGTRSEKGTVSKPFSHMNEHEKAAVAHETMNNGQSGAHKTLADKHRRMNVAN